MLRENTNIPSIYYAHDRYPVTAMLVLFAGRGELIARFACALLLPLSIFLIVVLYIYGVRWGISILIFVAVLLFLYWPISDRIAHYGNMAAATGGDLPVQQQQSVPEVTPPEPLRRCGAVTRGLGASAIAALPAYAYEQKAGADDCAVCLGELQRGEAVKQLPACAHLFHDGCIDAWLKSHVNCPVCRCPVDTALALPEAAGVVVLTQ